MKDFKGKRWHIQHTHYMGKAGQLSSGGGKTKEFIEWEKNQIVGKQLELPLQKKIETWVDV